MKGAEEPTKRINLPSSQVPAATLPSFATKNSLRLFETLDIKTDFLSANPRSGRKRNRTSRARRRIEDFARQDTASEEWRSSVLQPPATKDEEQRHSPPSCGGPSPSTSPGPRRLPLSPPNRPPMSGVAPP
ncbi:hypothetical protein GWK47_035392 [Chionoecetes opilio]|uniref:Uncharacterized protein n=1 Tax=Chionoecetes opilio TaxID=41210 RepID=A0A8J4YN99_CHIOP|nr:hypothetical protein GWK47_035392 [Chionoecetes opilio]